MDTFDWWINIYWFDTLLPIAAKYEIYRKLFHTEALYGTTMILKSEFFPSVRPRFRIARKENDHG